METFPTKFFARNVQSDIDQNRMKKIEQELKIIRNKIVDSFQSSVSYHSEVQHDLLPDLSEDEQKSFYCMIKDELSQRGFTVRGKFNNGQLHLIIFSNEPRTTEMDRVLRPKTEVKRSRSSSVDAHSSGRQRISQQQQQQHSAIPTFTPLRLPGSTTSIQPKTGISKKPTQPKISEPGSRIRSNSVQGGRKSQSVNNPSYKTSLTTSVLYNQSTTLMKSKIPVFQTQKIPKRSLSLPTTPLNSTSPSKSPLMSLKAADQTPPLKSIDQATLNTPTSEPANISNSQVCDTKLADPVTPIELNMNFIMDKLKKANEKRQFGNKSNV